MWDRQSIDLMKRLLDMGDYTAAEVARALTRKIGRPFRTDMVQTKIARMRAAGDLPKSTSRDLRRFIKPELRTGNLPPPSKVDECIGELFTYCQWIDDHGKKCGCKIEKRYPGVKNYCGWHQVVAVRSILRPKVAAFHNIEMESAE